eukprot:GFYU01003452.1.p1 GENE.GFYU01003452.1~~GFYU01003452.1.p1  ORF type:complete len:161 (+),score=37.34 GFYU01003452.1:142-624(+)
MEQFKKLVGVQEKEPSVMDDVGDNCSMSRKNRMYGFAICFGCGALCSLLSCLFLPAILIHPGRFAVTYTLGNLLSLGSTAFIIGPMRQLKNMFSKTRLIASIVYLVTMIATLVCAFQGVSPILIIFLILIQLCALAWYVASYIPYARQMITSCCKSTVGI